MMSMGMAVNRAGQFVEGTHHGELFLSTPEELLVDLLRSHTMDESVDSDASVVEKP